MPALRCKNCLEFNKNVCGVLFRRIGNEDKSTVTGEGDPCGHFKTNMPKFKDVGGKRIL